MSKSTILLTGATGTVGQATLKALRALPEPHNFRVLAAVTDPARTIPDSLKQADGIVKLDFADAMSFGPALEGVDKVLLVRPPQLSGVDKYFRPFIEALKQAGAYGKRCLCRFKNLSTTHRAEIRDRNEIFVPAGHGRTSFVDVKDLGEVAALVLTQDGHLNQAYELTGSEALTYEEVAAQLSEVLGRKITYQNPWIVQFLWRKVVTEQQPLAFALVMTALYTVAKLGKADGLTGEVERLLQRPPTTFRAFAERERSAWIV